MRAGLRGNVDEQRNAGSPTATQMHQINGSYVRRLRAHELAIEVGTFLNFSGAAQLDGGELHVLGKAAGLRASASQRETFLRASGGLNGTFGSLTAAPGVLLQATHRLRPDRRMVEHQPPRRHRSRAEHGPVADCAVECGSVSKARSMPSTTGQLGGQPGLDDFHCRRRRNPGHADRGGGRADPGQPLRRTARCGHRVRDDGHRRQPPRAGITRGCIAGRAGRRRLVRRPRRRSGRWRSSTCDVDGWMIGQDRRLGDRLTVGMALARDRGLRPPRPAFDREHNRQAEAQFYGSYDLGRGYLLGSLALGRMQRWTQRDMLLGDESFRVDSRLRASLRQRRPAGGPADARRPRPHHAICRRADIAARSRRLQRAAARSVSA